jgi:very-short-patch-repair endonuclease
MKNPLIRRCCCNCLKPIANGVHQFSICQFEYALCTTCQRDLRQRMQNTTPHTLALYFLLRKKGIKAQLEKDDGFKTIDIAVVNTKLNIEVDGSHHNTQHNQALADLQRTFYSFEKGYYTLRIPNSLVKNRPVETAEYVAKFVALSLRKMRS